MSMYAEGLHPSDYCYMEGHEFRDGGSFREWGTAGMCGLA